MATGTLPGRSVKHTTDVTGSTVRSCDGSLQGKAGCKVIEI